MPLLCRIRFIRLPNPAAKVYIFTEITKFLYDILLFFVFLCVFCYIERFMNEILLKQRVVDLLEERGLKVAEFSRLCGISQTTLNTQINGNGKIGAQTIIAILAVFDNISAEWLLRDKGDKYVTKTQAEYAPYVNQPGAHDNAQHFGSGDINVGTTGKKTMTKDEMLQTLLQQQQQIINLMKE